MTEQRVNILVYKSDGTLIAQYLLGDGVHLIGRDINCPVYLDSEYISANHAKLHLGADGIYVEDLNSTSGTFLNGVTVRGKLRVKPGQVLQVGDLTIDLQPESTENIGPGSRLADGRYTLIRLLGRGGMGEVWLANDEQLEEEVALKKLPPEVGADAMALADMRREVQKSRILSHPNIIRIHDLYAKSGEDPLITLEYVDGTDLTAIAATKTNGIFNWAEIKPLILQLCSALEFAHEQKIVHRDLKPANLMVSRKSQVKLADFGIAATMADSLSRSSMQGFISGTTLYMSPQQMEGEAPQASDDIYAFGSTIYELLTSRPPFYTGDVQHQVLEVTPKPMDQRLAEFGFTNDIPEHIQQLVMSCLAKEPEGRPKDMAAIIQWIKSKGQEKGAVPKHTTKTVRRSRTANLSAAPELSPAKKGAKIAAMIGAVALAIGLGIWVKNQITELGSVQEQAQNSGNKTSNPAVTQPTNPATQPTNPATTGKERLLWAFETGYVVLSTPAIGSDGTVYVGSSDNKLYAINGKSGEKKWEFETESMVWSSSAIGSDGTVYFGSWDNKLYAINCKTGGKLWEFETGSSVRSSPAIGSDGTVYVGSWDKKVYAINGQSGVKLWEFETDGEIASSPAIGSDGTVYIGSWDKKLYAISGKTGDKLWEFETEKAINSSPAIGSDGTVYIGSLDKKLYAINGKTGNKLWEFETWNPISRSSPAIGMDGTVYVGSKDNKLYAINGKTGAKLWEFETGGAINSSPAIGSDGTVYIGSLDKKLYAINGKTGNKLWGFETDGEVNSSPCIGPDGIVYMGSRDKKIYAIKSDSKGLTKSPWPMFGQNLQRTGRVNSTATSTVDPAPSGPITPESLKKGLTGYYPFNGNAKDESGNNFHGTLQELYKLTTDQRGTPNSAYQFDGELGLISIPGKAHWNTKDKGTVSLWFKAPPTGIQGTLFSEVSPGHSVWRYISIAKDGTVRADIGNPGSRVGGKKTTNGEWIHVCFLWRDNNNSSELYVNGIFAGKNEKKYWNLSNPEWINVATSGGNDRLDISIGDLRLYNRDLSAAEVKALYEFEKAKE